MAVTSDAMVDHRGDPLVGAERALLYRAGGRIALSTGDYLSVVSEVAYAKRGYDTSEAAIEHFRLRSSYVELSGLLEAGIPAGVARPKLLGGPFVAYFLTGRTEESSPGLGPEPFTYDIDRDNVNDLQFGLSAGAGIDFDLSAATLSFDIRYAHNLTEYFAEDILDEANIHHTRWSANIGLLFGVTP